MSADESKNPWVVHTGSFKRSTAESPLMPSPLPEAPGMPEPKIHHSLDHHANEVRRICSLNLKHPDPRVFRDDPNKMVITGFTGPRLVELLRQASRLAFDAESEQQELMDRLSEVLNTFDDDHLAMVKAVFASTERAARTRGMLETLLELHPAVVCEENIAAASKKMKKREAQEEAMRQVKDYLARHPEVWDSPKEWMYRYVQCVIVKGVDDKIRRDAWKKAKEWPRGDGVLKMPSQRDCADGWFYPSSFWLRGPLAKLLGKLMRADI